MQKLIKRFLDSGQITRRKEYTATGLVDKINESTLGNVVKFFDPTGITNYYDAYKSVNNFIKHPSAGSFGEATLDVVGSLPFVGKLGKIYRLSKTPLFVKAYKKASPLSNTVGKGIAYISNQVYNGALSKGLKNNIRRNVRDNLKDVQVLSARFTNSGSTIDYNINDGKLTKSLLYNIGSHSGGNASFIGPFVGIDGSIRRSVQTHPDENIYNGSYVFGVKPKMSYTGTAKGNIDILSDFIYGRDADSIYNYPIIPLDTIFINQKDKNRVNNNNHVFLNLDFADIKNLKNRDKYKKVLIDAKTVSGNIDNNGLHLNDTWDMIGSTGFFGDRFEHILNKDGKYHAVKYKQDIPIIVTSDINKVNYTNDLLKSIHLDKQLFKEYNEEYPSKFGGGGCVGKRCLATGGGFKILSSLYKLATKPPVKLISKSFGNITKTVLKNGKVRLSLPTHTEALPRLIVLEPAGDNKFYIHMRIWDDIGNKIPGSNVTEKEKQQLFDALYKELPEGAEILFPESGPGNYATRGTVAGLLRLSRDDRFVPGNTGILQYKDDKTGLIKEFQGTSFIKKK